MFISANSILYYGKVEDPIFAATSEIKNVLDNGKNATLYTSDYFVNPLGCVDQHQFCNPASDKCTKLDSYDSAVRSAQADLDLNSMQYGTVSTLSLDLYLSTISPSESHQAVSGLAMQLNPIGIGGRGSAALRAQEITSGLFSGPLPVDQWKTEVRFTFLPVEREAQVHATMILLLCGTISNTGMYDWLANYQTGRVLVHYRTGKDTKDGCRVRYRTHKRS